MGMLERLELQSALERLFERKRSAFLEEHGLLKRPALVLQSMPDEPLSVDFEAAAVAEAMSQGGGQSADDGWWNALRFTGQPNLTFDGLTSRRKSYPEEWASELQADGSIIVGVWNFPRSSPQEPGSAAGVGVADFYTQLFDDFAYLSSKVHAAAGYSAAVHATCTMHLANQLPMVNAHAQVIAPASNRSTLRWPIAEASVSGLQELGARMATQFYRIYGRKLRKQGR